MTLEETIYEKLCGWSFQDHLNHLEIKNLTQHEILHSWKPPVDLIAERAITLAHELRKKIGAEQKKQREKEEKAWQKQREEAERERRLNNYMTR